ncbi:MAG: hypothetical protein QGH45_09950, partial [Myxococcota bacterium]|nr:hypothetical protein [Myxococcota bacterium]
MGSIVKCRGPLCRRQWTVACLGGVLAALLSLGLASSAAAGEGEGGDGAVSSALCTLEGLRVTGETGEQLIPLPGRCVAAHGDGEQTVVAGGADGAWLVDHPAGQAAQVTPIPSMGVVLDVQLRDGYALLTEQVDQVRVVDLEGLVRAAAERATPVEVAAGDAADPDDIEPARRLRVGTVVAVRGPRVFVAGDGIVDGPTFGDWIAVVRPTIPRDVDPATGQLRNRGQPGYESVIRVVGNDGQQLVAEVGRGDRARLGDEVYAGSSLEPTERLADPRPIRPLPAVGVELVPAISLSDPGVVGLGRAWVSYSFRFPMRVEVALRQGVLAVPRDGGPVVGGAAEVLASLDL